MKEEFDVRKEIEKLKMHVLENIKEIEKHEEADVYDILTETIDTFLTNLHIEEAFKIIMYLNNYDNIDKSLIDTSKDFEKYVFSVCFLCLENYLIDYLVDFKKN